MSGRSSSMRLSGGRGATEVDVKISQLDSLFMIDQVSPQEIYWISTIRGIYVEIDRYFWQGLLVSTVSLN